MRGLFFLLPSPSCANIWSHLHANHWPAPVFSAKGAARATPREARARTAEDDGTLAAEEAEEIARREAIEWDEFKEANPRGAGNTMNRG